MEHKQSKNQFISRSGMLEMGRKLIVKKPWFLAAGGLF